MNQTQDASSPVLREAFYSLSAAQEIPDAKLLDDVIRRYPQFAEELTEFAIALAVDALRGDHGIEAAEADIDPSVVSPTVGRTMSYFQNRLHAVTTGVAAVGGVPVIGTIASNPFLELPRTEFRALAQRLNANAVFVGKLRDRQVDPATMTAGFRRRVADELAAPLDLVVAHFSARQEAPRRQFFMAEGKPGTGARQSFEEAVRTSGLSEAQQEFLLGL